MDATDRDIQKEIAAAVGSNAIVLFMKGSPQFPQCGFSAAAVKMLTEAGATDYVYVNVLEDGHIREGVKEFSSWPTIPQLYVRQEFIGGADIMRELHASGELAKLIATQNN